MKAKRVYEFEQNQDITKALRIGDHRDDLEMMTAYQLEEAIAESGKTRKSDMRAYIKHRYAGRYTADTLKLAIQYAMDSLR